MPGFLFFAHVEVVESFGVEFRGVVVVVAVKLFVDTEVVVLDVLFHLFEVYGLGGRVAHGFGADGLFQVFAGDDFAQFHEECAFGHVVEDEEHALFLLFKQFAQSGFTHDPRVFVIAGFHVHQRNLGFLFPVVLADEERGQLVFGKAHRVEYGVVQFEKRRFGIDFYFAGEVVDFVGENQKFINHSISRTS